MSITSRILKVGAAKSLEMAIVTLVRFVSVPLFLHAWTTEMYGEWLILYSLLAYFSLGNLGFAQAGSGSRGNEKRRHRVCLRNVSYVGS
jgi:hypothetical protein